jgi:hypothetical protein
MENARTEAQRVALAGGLIADIAENRCLERSFHLDA